MKTIELPTALKLVLLDIFIILENINKSVEI